MSAGAAWIKTSRPCDWTAFAEKIGENHAGPVLRLAQLAPDIVEAILAGTMGPAVGFEQLERRLPASWEEQRQMVLPAATQLHDWQPCAGYLMRWAVGI